MKTLFCLLISWQFFVWHDCSVSGMWHWVEETYRKDGGMYVEWWSLGESLVYWPNLTSALSVSRTFCPLISLCITLLLCKCASPWKKNSNTRNAFLAMRVTLDKPPPLVIRNKSGITNLPMNWIQVTLWKLLCTKELYFLPDIIFQSNKTGYLWASAH